MSSLAPPCPGGISVAGVAHRIARKIDRTNADILYKSGCKRRAIRACMEIPLNDVFPKPNIFAVRVKALVCWATGKRLTDRLAKLSLTTCVSAWLWRNSSRRTYPRGCVISSVIPGTRHVVWCLGETHLGKLTPGVCYIKCYLVYGSEQR